MRCQLEIMLQQTITSKFDVFFSTVNINCWHCFSHYHLQCLSDSSTTNQFDISLVSIQKKCWKRPPVILKSASRSSYCMHVELEQKHCKEQRSWRQVQSKHSVPSSQSRNNCGKHWNKRLCRHIKGKKTFEKKARLFGWGVFPLQANILLYPEVPLFSVKNASMVVMSNEGFQWCSCCSIKNCSNPNKKKL